MNRGRILFPVEEMRWVDRPLILKSLLSMSALPQYNLSSLHARNEVSDDTLLRQLFGIIYQLQYNTHPTHPPTDNPIQLINY